MESGALFSPCRTYRYLLWRRWRDGPTLAFVMLNPSTAGEVENDPTVERCLRRADAAGHGALAVVNLFALRSTDPKALYAHADPVGPRNDDVIAATALEAGLVVCALGTHGALEGRGREVLATLGREGVVPHALKVSKDGHPCHPLYLPYALLPTPFAPGSGPRAPGRSAPRCAIRASWSTTRRGRSRAVASSDVDG